MVSHRQTAQHEFGLSPVTVKMLLTEIGGHVKSTVSNAVSAGEEIIRNATELFNFCTKKMAVRKCLIGSSFS